MGEGVPLPMEVAVGVAVGVSVETEVRVGVAVGVRVGTAVRVGVGVRCGLNLEADATDVDSRATHSTTMLMIPPRTIVPIIAAFQ